MDLTAEQVATLATDPAPAVRTVVATRIGLTIEQIAALTAPYSYTSAARKMAATVDQSGLSGTGSFRTFEKKPSMDSVHRPAASMKASVDGFSVERSPTRSRDARLTK